MRLGVSDEERKPEEEAQDAPPSSDPPAAPGTPAGPETEASEEEPAAQPDAPPAEDGGEQKPAEPEPKPAASEDGGEQKPAEPAPPAPNTTAPVAAKPAPAKKEEEPPKMSSNEDVNAFASHFSGRASQEADIEPGIPAFRVGADHLMEAITFLKNDRKYDHLACITAIDWKDRFEVVYNLWSYAKNRPVALRVDADREDPVVPSVAGLWRCADWLEREEYDLMGIRFEGHPDLRRILLPEGWVGHPLRKDYDNKHEQYVGMNAAGDDVVYQEPREDAW